MVWIMEKHLDRNQVFKNLPPQLWLYKTLLCVVFALPHLSYGAASDTIFSKYNDQYLLESKDKEAFHFFLGGHLYGDGGHQASLYPSPSLLANIDTINNSGASFFVSLGDNVRVSNNIQWSNFRTSFTNRLKMPFFSVMGNHDTLANAELAVQLFGPTFYSFRYHNNAFVFVDTIVNDGRLNGTQLEWLKKTLEDCKNDGLSNVFLIGHMVIWQDNLEDSDFKLQNSYENIFNFKEDVLPSLLDLRSKNIGVFVFSDDIGGGDDNPNFMFHHKDTKSGIEYMSTGIGNNKNDALIHAFIDKDNKPHFEGFSLTGKTLPEIADFDIAYWKENMPYRGLSNKFKKRLYNNNFRLGAMFAFALVFSLLILWRIIIVIKRVRYGKR